MNLMRGVTVCQEMERGKREREKYQVYLELGQRRGSWVSAQVGEWRGIPVCSVQGRGADWRTLTSAQQEQLDSITQSTEGSHAAVLHGRGLGGGMDGPGDGQSQPTNQPTNTIRSGSSVFAQGNWVDVPVLNEPLQRPQGGLKATWGKLLRPSV